MKRFFKNLSGVVVIIGLIIFLLLWDFSKRIEGFFRRLSEIMLIILAGGLFIDLAIIVFVVFTFDEWWNGRSRDATKWWWANDDGY